jgi:DeoR family transcriptional regulator, catabolite repression regulator
MSTQNKNLTVGNVMLLINDFPVVSQSTILKETLEKMDSISMGIACIVGSNQELLGIITDGDIRRKLLAVQKPSFALFIDDTINQAIKEPVTASSGMSLIGALNLMENKRIWDLPVVDNGKLVGLLHLHSAIKVLLELD